MSADILHAIPWDEPDTQYFVALGLGRDELALHEAKLDRSAEYITSKTAAIDVHDTVACFTYSPKQFGVAAIGNSAGTVRVYDFIHSPKSLLQLEPRQSRQCSTLSFNSAGLIAAGLDKTRNEDSLLIWDAQKSGSDDGHSAPIVSTLANESVTAVEFLASNPNLLLAATYKSIRELDIRLAGTGHHIPTRYAYGLRLSPVDDTCFLSYNEGGTVALWDRRQLGSSVTAAEPLLLIPRVLSDSRAKAPRSLHFSNSANNEFAALHDGGLIRKWKVSKTSTENMHVGPVSNLSSAVTGGDSKPKTALNFNLFVQEVYDVTTDYDKVTGFDFAINPGTGQTDFVCIRQSGQVFRMAAGSSPSSLYFNPNNDLLVLESNALIKLDGNKPVVHPSHAADKDTRRDSESFFDGDTIADDDSYKLRATEKRLDNLNLDPRYGDAAGSEELGDNDDGFLPYSEVLRNDVAQVMKRRALYNYSHDCDTNLKVLDSPDTASAPVLASAWRWLQKARITDTEGLMATESVDLSYCGVHNLWDGLKPLTREQRFARGSSKVTEKEFDSAVQRIVAKFPAEIFVSPQCAKGPKAGYRQLCLRTVGWNFPISELEAHLKRLESEGLHEKAAAWAVFHGDVERAVGSLSSSRKGQLRLMSSAVAGYLVYKDVETNNPWREQCRKLASEMSMPYLRAIFAYAADGSWFDVLDDGSLPLTERLGIAFRFLEDKDLTRYLARLTERAIRNGDIEGIMLTGLSPSLLDLLETFVDKTSDVQTAALIMTFGSPRFFSNFRVDVWTATYKNLLNKWRFFRQRASFDVAHNKLAKSRCGISVQPPIPTQVFLKCIHCKTILGGKRDSTTPLTRCPRCNAPLPCCAVCLLPLGPVFESPAESWPTFCMSCSHGYHRCHAQEWFRKYEVCPVPDCQCMCGSA